MNSDNACSVMVRSSGDRIKKIFFFLVRFVVSFGILYYLFTLIPLGKVLETIRIVNVWMVILAVLLTQLMSYVSAMKSKILTDEHNLSLTVGYIFKVNYVTQFFGLFLPEVISSGLIRWHKLSKPDGKPAEAFASMFLCRLTEIFIFLCLGLVFWFLDKTNTSSKLLGVILAVSIVVSVMVYYVVFNRNVSKIIMNVISGCKFIPQIILKKINNVLVATSYYQGLKKVTLFRIVVLNISKDLIGILSIYILALSVKIDVDFISIGWIRSFLLLFALLPISVSSIGIQEGSLVYFLGSFGYSTQSALVLSLLLHLRRLIGGGIGGLIQALELVLTPKDKKEVERIAVRVE